MLDLPAGVRECTWFRVCRTLEKEPERSVSLRNLPCFPCAPSRSRALDRSTYLYSQTTTNDAFKTASVKNSIFYPSFADGREWVPHPVNQSIPNPSALIINHYYLDSIIYILEIFTLYLQKKCTIKLHTHFNLFALVWKMSNWWARKKSTKQQQKINQTTTKINQTTTKKLENFNTIRKEYWNLTHLEHDVMRECVLDTTHNVFCFWLRQFHRSCRRFEQCSQVSQFRNGRELFCHNAVTKFGNKLQPSLLSYLLNNDSKNLI